MMFFVIAQEWDGDWRLIFTGDSRQDADVSCRECVATDWYRQVHLVSTVMMHLEGKR